jgi:hypothetical protein
MAMRVESSVTSLSWLPSEAVTGLMRFFASGLSHYDPRPPGQLDDLNGCARTTRSGSRTCSTLGPNSTAIALLRPGTAGCGSPRPPVDAPRSGCRGEPAARAAIQTAPKAAPIGPTPVPVKGFDNGEGLDNGNV